jgi:hypothetical protein
MNNRDINNIQTLIDGIKSLEKKNIKNIEEIKKLSDRITDIIKNTDH